MVTAIDEVRCTYEQQFSVEQQLNKSVRYLLRYQQTIIRS
jgi:hypothetical protein